ncbi:MAG: hypothetical protein WBO70_02620 [Erysipelotrichaceae bacterium]
MSNVTLKKRSNNNLSGVVLIIGIIIGSLFVSMDVLRKVLLIGTFGVWGVCIYFSIYFTWLFIRGLVKFDKYRLNYLYAAMGVFTFVLVINKYLIDYIF